MLFSDSVKWNLSLKKNIIMILTLKRSRSSVRKQSKEAINLDKNSIWMSLNIFSKRIPLENFIYSTLIDFANLCPYIKNNWLKANSINVS